MCKLCLLVACLACGCNGRRFKATLDQHFSSQDMKVSSQDVKDQTLTKQLNWSAGSTSHGQANHSASEQFAQHLANPMKAVPILLSLFSPAVVFAPTSDGLPLNSSIYNNSQQQIESGANGPERWGRPERWRRWWTRAMGKGPNVVMMDQSDGEEVLPEVRGPVVRVVVSVEWEGLDLRKENLRFFQDFREAHPDVPLTHFLNAAYFTKSEGQSIHEWSPSEALSPIDEQGLAIHVLKSLVEASDVQYRSEPNVLLTPEEVEKSLEKERELQVLMEIGSSEWDSSGVEWEHSAEWFAIHSYLNRDVGYDTDIRAYCVNELQAIIATAKVLLEEHGFKVGKSFRVGSRLAGANVLDAFQREGFRVNSSAVSHDESLGRLPPAEKEFWRDVPLFAMLSELWPGITEESQPYLVQTQLGWVLEMPDTGGPADDSSVQDMIDHIDRAVQQLTSEDRFVQIGFHQETAAKYGARVTAAISEIKRKHGHRVVFETLGASARRVKAKIKAHVAQRS